VADPTRYDEVPYSSYPYPRTQPDRLCALARLFGLRAADPRRCTVLELGCASGGNLVPLAERYPEARFVGVDASARQITAGQELIDSLGLTNVTLRHGDILEVDGSWGEFDYVVCHGVYSWVPRPVQDHILAICRDRLRDDGIGYISYNTYPGWHVREMVRHMMRWHVRGFPEPARQVQQARALVDFLARAVDGKPSAYGAMLGRELAILSRAGDDYLFHEHLEECNSPLYFHEFAERLDHHALQYLCESDVHMMFAREFPDEVHATLDRIAPDLVHMEQYVDFVRNRQFRASLVCHRSRVPVRSLGSESVMDLRLGFAGTADATPCDLSPGVSFEFMGADGVAVNSSEPITKAALLVLRRRWPDDLPFGVVWEAAAGLLREAGIVDEAAEASRRRLASDLLACLVAGGPIELRSTAAVVAVVPGDRPRTTASARWLARRHGWAASARHQRVDLDAPSIEILCACDGTRDREALLEALLEAVAAGRLVAEVDGAPLGSEAAHEGLRGLLAPILAATLERLAGVGMFVG
jgi:SAM-dependent methyltransferase